MPDYHPSMGAAEGAALAHNARLAAGRANRPATEQHPASDTGHTAGVTGRVRAFLDNYPFEVIASTGQGDVLDRADLEAVMAALADAVAERDRLAAVCAIEGT